MQNWAHWSPFTDPEMKIEYKGEKTGVGAIQSWVMQGDSEKLTIIESNPYKSIKTDVDLVGDDDINGYWFFDEENGKTKVVWGINFHNLSYPFERYVGVLMKYMMKNSLEKGLANLKKYAESLPEYPDIKQGKIEARKSISIKDTVYYNEMAEKMDRFYTMMGKYAKQKGTAMAGPPFCIYYDWKPEENYTVVRCGFPVDKEIPGMGIMEYFEVTPSDAAILVYKGAYDQMESAYNALDEYIAEFDFEMNGPPMEVYITDPNNEPDTSKWVTNIYFPVK